MDWLLLIVPGVIWGSSFLFIAEGLEATGPNGVTFLRILIGFATLALFKGSRKSVPREDWPRIAVIAVVWMAFPLTLFPYAEQRVSSAITGMLNGAVPLTTAIVAAAMARKLPARGIVAGLAVGLLGAVLMALPMLGQGSSTTTGVLMIVVAVMSYGFALNVTRPLQIRHGALPVIWRAQLVALVLTAPLGIPELIDARWSLKPLLAMLALGALGTGVAFVVAATASGRLGATKASATAFLIPPVALLLGVLVRHESVAALSVLGGAVCLAGAWLMRQAQLGMAPPRSAFSPPPLALRRDGFAGSDQPGPGRAVHPRAAAG
jgi:drug/metabolite transporter (DMT)-like permease